MQRALPSLTVAAVFGCIITSGCGGATTAFTRTGPTLPAQPGTCEFAVVSAAPGAATELGTIDIKYMKQTDWIYDEKVFKRKVAPQVCQNGGDTVVPRINDNGLYMSASVYTTKSAPAAPDAPAPAAPPEPEAIDPVPEPAAAAKPAAPAATPEKSAQAAAKPETKAAPAKDDEAAKAVPGKKGGKKGATAKKDDNIRGKDGKIDIDKLL